ncbi:MAG: hypothetical protein H7235_09795 [Bdellovibrionaceae bacterium]|nr:hypothetical protein [Pseudobdellovibrionaceae bacterium]
MKWLNKLFNFLIVLIVVGYGAFYFHNESKLKNPQAGGQYELSSNDIERVVNKYLKQTTETIEKERFNSDKALYKAMREPIKITVKTPETNPADVPVSKQIWKESEVDVSPADVVRSNVFDEFAFEKQDEANRKQYARDFIENARRGGFHVVLSDDLTKIVSVTPIRKPSQEDDSTESNPSN